MTKENNWALVHCTLGQYLTEMHIPLMRSSTVAGLVQ